MTVAVAVAVIAAIVTAVAVQYDVAAVPLLVLELVLLTYKLCMVKLLATL